MMRAGYVYGLNDECLVIYVLCMIEMQCDLKSNNNALVVCFFGPLPGTGRMICRSRRQSIGPLP